MDWVNSYLCTSVMIMDWVNSYLCISVMIIDWVNSQTWTRTRSEFVFMNLSCTLFSFTFSFRLSLHVLSVYLNRRRSVVDWFTNQISNLYWKTTWYGQVIAQNSFYCIWKAIFVSNWAYNWRQKFAQIVILVSQWVMSAVSRVRVSVTLIYLAELWVVFVWVSQWSI